MAKWTSEETYFLLQKRSLGVTYTRIGQELGRSKCSCISRHQLLKGIRRGRLYIPTGKPHE